MVNQQISTDLVQVRINTAELLNDLWRQKWLILFFILLSTALGSFYLVNKKTTYETSAYIWMPTENDVVVFNAQRSSKIWFKNKFVYLLKRFNERDLVLLNRKVLLGNSTKQNFFRSYYLPVFAKQADNKLSADQLYKQMEKKITLKEPPANSASLDNYTLLVRGPNLEQNIQWAKDYVSLASSEAAKKIELLANNQTQALLKNLSQQIDAIHELSKNKRQEHLVQLQDALKFSLALGKSEREDLVFSNNSDKLNSVALATIASRSDKNLMYLRGSKILKSEIETLNNKQSEEAYSVAGLPELEEAYKFYKNLSLNPEILPVFHLGEEDIISRAVPSHASFILCFFVIIGLMLGGFIAMVRSFLKQIKQV